MSIGVLAATGPASIPACRHGDLDLDDFAILRANWFRDVTGGVPLPAAETLETAALWLGIGNFQLPHRLREIHRKKTCRLPGVCYNARFPTLIG
jgi:hypothetical protein